MYYYGYFRNTDTSKDVNGQLYKVVIITDFQNRGYTKRGGELKLTANPFTVSYQGEDDNLFKPYKCSTATVSFYLDKINKDLYSVRGNDIYVSLLKLKDGVQFREHDFIEGSINYPSTYDYKEYTVEWSGFATPNAYNQSFVSEFDVFEMECQDALSTLQYYNYKPCKETISVNKLSDILKNIVANLRTYKRIFITDVFASPNIDYSNYNILEYLFINERNFYNEDDEPLNMLEVLKNILQYLSLTVVPYGDSLYIIDYNAIAKGFNTYHLLVFERDLEDNHFLPFGSFESYKEIGTCYLVHNCNITADDIAANDVNYSLSSTYNKVKVTDNYYFTNGNNLFDDLLNSNLFSEVGEYMYGSVIKASELFTFIISNNEKFYINYYGYNNDESKELEVNTYWYSRYYRHGDANGLWTFDEVTGFNENRIWNIDTCFANVGAVLTKYDVKNIANNDTPSLKEAIFFPSIEDDNLIVYSYLPKEGETQQKVIDFTLKNQIISDNDYLVINGDFTFYNDEIPLPFTQNVTTAEFKSEHCYIWAKLECNYMCWNGSEWVYDDAVFQIPLTYNGTPNSFGTVFPIKSNAGFDNDLPKFGYGIKLPVEKGVSSSDIKLTLFRIWGVDRVKMSRLTVLENFSLEVVGTVKELINKNNTSNTEYTNTINNSAIEEYSDVSLDITTYNGKDKDYSTVYCMDEYYSYNEDRYKLKVLHNLVTGNLLTPEEHIISNICRQYALPNINLQLSLHGEFKPYSLLTYSHFEGSKFVVDSMNIDYSNNISNLKLIEKLETEKVSSFEAKSKKRDYQRNGDIINNAQQIKKDGKVIKHSLMKGVGLELSMDSVVYNKVDEFDFHDDLGGSESRGANYSRFYINEKGELIFYRPNIQSNLSAEITDEGILQVNINDSIIII